MCDAPAMLNSVIQVDGFKMLDTLLPVSASQLLAPIPVRSVFSRESGWVMRGFSPQEIGSTMYLPVGFLKALSIVAYVDSSVLTKLVAMPPTKIIQSDSANILVPSSNGIDVDIIISEYTASIKKLYLQSSTTNISVTNLADAHSKVVQSDDALMDKGIWNLNPLMALSGRNQSLYQTLTEVYNITTHGLVFAQIRVNISQRFVINIKKYLIVIYILPILPKS